MDSAQGVGQALLGDTELDLGIVLSQQGLDLQGGRLLRVKLQHPTEVGAVPWKLQLDVPSPPASISDSSLGRRLPAPFLGVVGARPGATFLSGVSQQATNVEASLSILPRDSPASPCQSKASHVD
jgi:hypothetical protein